MPLMLENRLVYRIGEALETAQVSRATYFRWIREGRVSDARYRDRNGRRVLTPEEVRSLASVANRLVDADASGTDPAQLELVRSDG